MTIEPERTLWRIYFRGGRHPTVWNAFRHWGPANGRFDHHLPDEAGEGQTQERGVLYTAHHIGICLAEVFQDGRFIDRYESNPWLVGFTPTRPLKLLDLTGIWPTRAGASAAINSGRRDRARRWSKAFYEAYNNIDGLAYASSIYGNGLSMAIYERAADALPDRPALHMPLDHPGLTAALDCVASRIGYRLS